MGYSPIKTIQQCSFSRSILRYLFREQIFSPTDFLPKLQYLNWNTYRRTSIHIMQNCSGLAICITCSVPVRLPRLKMPLYCSGNSTKYRTVPITIKILGAKAQKAHSFLFFHTRKEMRHSDLSPVMRLVKTAAITGNAVKPFCKSDI